MKTKIFTAGKWRGNPKYLILELLIMKVIKQLFLCGYLGHPERLKNSLESPQQKVRQLTDLEIWDMTEVFWSSRIPSTKRKSRVSEIFGWMGMTGHSLKIIGFQTTHLVSKTELFFPFKENLLFCEISDELCWWAMLIHK